MQYKKVSIVIPVYNEIETIGRIIHEVKKASVHELSKEIIIVDDHSTDGTTEFLLKMGDTDIWIYYHEKNYGKGAALKTGFRQATGDIIVVQDADLEYDPAEITSVLKPFFEGASVVYGSRYLDSDRLRDLGFWHSSFNRLFTALANLLLHTNLTDIMTCYKAFSREVMNKFIEKMEAQRFGFEPEVTARVARLKYKIHEVSISYTPRSKVQGKHMTLKHELECLWVLIKYSLLR